MPGVEILIIPGFGFFGISGIILMVSVLRSFYDAMSEGSFIEKGEKIRVIRHEAGQVYVVKDIK